MSDINVDDTDTTSILYTGSWVALGGGPPDEFDGTVHSTNDSGASATIRFQGNRIVLRCTVPEGTGSMSMISFLDGKMISLLTRPSHSDMAFYNDTWFDTTTTLADGVHELTVQNAGGASDSPFQLDRFIITGSVIPVPPGKTVSSSSVGANPATPAGRPSSTQSSSTALNTKASPSQSSLSISSGLSSSTSSSTSGTSSSVSSATAGITTVTESGQTVTLVTAADGSIQTQGVSLQRSSGSHFSSNIGGVVGSVLGGIACLLFLVLLFLFYSRRRRLATQHRSALGDSERPGQPRDMSSITPFVLNDSHARSGTKIVPPADLVYTLNKAHIALSGPSDEITYIVSCRFPEPIDHTAGTYEENNVQVHANDNSVSPDQTTENTTDGRVYRPHSLSRSREGLIFPKSPRGTRNPSQRSNHSNPRPPRQPTDINDFPPSYQSIRNHDSYHLIHVQTPSTLGSGTR
ncbi:hypothetical protein D9613_010057 [Agrocybe pediades]|uniref:Uncharacterized protein n=1 Tax=Agrocybe pediades TaxID=84607 RepID=A0A8H4VSC7_9AGAR|nr:hypothetical protein D9613_010057 [Agrocybe pediades]